MKKLILLFLAGTLILSISSCKKTYTCSCSTTYTFKNSNNNGYTTIIIPAEKKAYSRKMSEKKAKVACTHEGVAIQTNFENGITGNGYYSLDGGESIFTNCAITL
jgi:hypothetical protein